MADLTVGTFLASTGTSQIDSLVPSSVTTSKTLIAGTDLFTLADPSLGNIVLTLPPVVDGVIFIIFRVINGFNTVTVSGEDIDGGDSSLVLGLPGQKVTLIGDATNNTYRSMTSSLSAFGTLERTTTDTHSVGSSYGLYDEWETIVFQTPGRLIPSLANDNIDYIHDEINAATPQVGFNISFSMVFEDSAGKNCSARIMFNPTSGSPIQLAETAVFGQGSGKIVSMRIIDQVGITDTGVFYVEVQSEDPDTWTVYNAKLNVSRITG